MATSFFENFPLRMVIACNAVCLAIYGIGVFLISRWGVVWGSLYAAFCIWMEWRVISGGCRSCYYFGKRCGFGKGKACSWFFSKREGSNFSTKQITWLDIVPDFMVSLIPLGAGIAVLIRSFSWVVLLLIIIMAGLGSAGTGFIRGQIACKYCRQREIGCPAEQLFSKRRSTDDAD